MVKKGRKQKPLKKSLKRTYIIIFVGLIFFSAIVLPLSFIPVETVRTGGCHTRTVRISWMLEGRERFDQIKAATQKRDKEVEEFLNRHPGLAMGCSAGPTYELYRL